MSTIGKVAAACALIAAGYVWGHYGVTRGWFPYPQIAEARAAASGEVPDERPDYAKPPSPGYQEYATVYERSERTAEWVIVGDSMLARAPWQELVPEREVANRAIPGDYAVWLKERLGPVVATEAERAVLMIGLNDATRGRSAEAIHRDILTAASVVADAGMEVVLVSPLPCAAQAAHCGPANATVAELNAMLRDDRGAAAHFIDLTSEMAPDGALLERYTADGVHMNLAAFDVVVERLNALDQT